MATIVTVLEPFVEIKDMGAPINTPSTGDIWNLSIDDLLAPLPETQRLGGPGPFVINLSASSAPVDVPAKGIVGYERMHAFLVQRVEDRRPRYRLRLGPFVTEDEADAALEKVRAVYPSALTATADAEDLRAMAAMQAKSDATQPRAEKPRQATRQTVTVTPVAAEVIPSISLLAVTADSMPFTPAVSSAPASAPASSAAIPTVTMAVPTSPAVSSPLPIPTVTTAVPVPTMAVAPVAAATPRAATPASAMAPPSAVVTAPRVVPPVETARSAIASAGVPTVKSAMPPAGTTVAIPKAATPTTKPVNAAPTQPPVQQIKKLVPNLDATQTVRALTQLELEDDQASRWFAIQLALAEDAFDPDVLPNLDIFKAYRLYSVAGIDQGRIVHALRMGFFSDEVGARAVASYLAAYYDKPTIKRVSSAERQRFADQRLEPRKDVGATGKQAVIEITNERFVRERRSTATISQKNR